ncbi:MAG: nicotinate phosphoribosyltransferase [Herpetosiphonaceae bacterium]|nr:MAG: nicotinate phosphoribosyltransferase [Herpetosiphonaceae bacterium]
MDGRQLTKGALYTDQYQLTMAQVYFRMGLHERPALFDHFFRRYPDYGQHQAGYCVSAGLDTLLEWMERVRFGDEEIAVLRAQRGRGGEPLFAGDFLQWLRSNGSFEALTVRAVPEGRVVHPHVPLTVVEGPLALAQILETALLNLLNFQTLIATKAARVRESAGSGLVLEFGLRRAQGPAGNLATRAALIGGADKSSNVGMSAAMGLQASGTHAHSLVQVALALEMGELEAFRAFAETYPDDTVLLVDTIDTLESGIPNAIKVFEELRRKGHRPIGIRLDSGDLAYLSIQAARMLDAAGFPDASIVLSSDLNELVIWQIHTQIRQEAPLYGVDPDHLFKRLVYGVGTQMVTSWGAPALNGVYKLVALQDHGSWQPVLKISESIEKTSNPGYKRAWRLYDSRGYATADLLTLQDENPAEQEQIVLRHPSDATKLRSVRRENITIEPLHETVFAGGRRMTPPPALEELRERRRSDIARLDPGVRRLVNPHIYHVSLSQGLWELKRRLIAEMQSQS